MLVSFHIGIFGLFGVSPFYVGHFCHMPAGHVGDLRADVERQRPVGFQPFLSPGEVACHIGCGLGLGADVRPDRNVLSAFSRSRALFSLRASHTLALFLLSSAEFSAILSTPLSYKFFYVCAFIW